MSADLPPTPILALEISNALLHLFGFGPSQSICRPFAEQVEAEFRDFRGDR